MTATILERIAAYKREEVAARREVVSPRDMDRLLAKAPRPRGFARALKARARDGKPALIAEIKKASPSKGLIRENFEPPQLARAYMRGGAACLSVLTDQPSFQGREADLVAARAACMLPVIRKDFLVDPWQVAESRTLGADCILVIMAMVDDALAQALMDAARRLSMDVLVEVHDEVEMARAARLGADLIGINNRNLHTFETRLETTEVLARLAPPGSFLIAESGIFSHDDVMRLMRAGARGFLVGESLMRQDDVEEATARLLGRIPA